MNNIKKKFYDVELTMLRDMLKIFEKSITINSINEMKIENQNEKEIRIFISFNTNINDNIELLINYKLEDNYKLINYSSKIDLNFFKNFEAFEYEIKKFIFERENNE